jgi:hypothetical protein
MGGQDQNAREGRSGLDEDFSILESLIVGQHLYGNSGTED